MPNDKNPIKDKQETSIAILPLIKTENNIDIDVMNNKA